jgi:general L-amino acid transport system permease protein
MSAWRHRLGRAWRSRRRRWWAAQAVMTGLGMALVVLVVWPALRWVVAGADWGVVTSNLRLFAAGQYPAALLWRPAICALGTAALLAASRRRPLRSLVAAWLLWGLACLLLLRGLAAVPGLPRVPPRDWGGLLLTLTLSVSALAAAFPLGVLLGLGRDSRLPLVKGLAILYIEVVRGVPLVTVLFMSQVMIPLVLPAGPWLDRVFRAMVGLALFTAAYLAEDVRGGLAAVGAGQREAALSLGLRTPATYRLIILPQALRAVVPSIAGQFIALFKDTSLAQIVGLNELLGIAVAVVAQPLWRGRAPESLVFAAAVYFVFCAAMARAGARLERPASLA